MEQRRRILKKLLRRTVLVLGVLLALAVLRIVVGRLAGPMLLENARARFQTEIGPLRLELADETIAGESNAGPLLLQAGAALDLTQEDRDLLSDLGEDRAAASDPGLQVRLRELAERNLASLALIDRAGERPESLMRRRRDYFLGNSDFDPLRRLLDLSKLIRAVGRLAVAENDDEALLISIERLSTLARALRQERIMVAWIVAGPVERLLHDLVHSRVERPVPAEAVARLDHALASVEGAPRFREILAAECSVADTVYPQMFGDGGASFWSDPLLPWDEHHFRAENLLSYVELAAVLDRPRVEWPELHEPTRWEILRLWVDPFSMPTVMRSIATPNLRDTVERAQRLQAEHTLARAAIRHLIGEVSPDLESVAYTGESIQRRTLDDGALELSLPGAAARLRAEAESWSDPGCDPRRSLEQQADRMTWRVAPPVKLSVPGDPTEI